LQYTSLTVEGVHGLLRRLNSPICAYSAAKFSG